MQKLSARRNSGSDIQRFSSTSSRCMIAIWPAGPPKLMKPSFSQKRNASAKLGGCRPGASPVAAMSADIGLSVARPGRRAGAALDLGNDRQDHRPAAGALIDEGIE